MTQPERSGKRDLTFSQWVRENLPDSKTGFMATDIDFFLYNYKTKKFLVLEIKTYLAPIKTWQRRFYQNLSWWLRNGVTNDWQFLGIHLISFEKTSPADGKIYLNNQEVTEDYLVNFLSMK